MSLSREATREAYERHRGIHHAADWPALADLFALDATYRDPFFGDIEGREAIRDFLVRSMTGLEDWTFPIAWVAVDEGQVVTHWHNRLPGRRRDGGFFEFPGMSAITYGDDGLITRQWDNYDRAECLSVIAEAKVPGFERTLRGLQGLAKPVVDGLHRLTAR